MPNDSTIQICQVCKGDINIGEEHICQGSQVTIEVVKGVPNPTGKGGFGEHPENINEGGRPKNSLKSYIARKLAEMSDEDKEKWLEEHKIDGKTQWTMGEGNPEQKSETDMKHTGEISIRDLFDRSK